MDKKQLEKYSSAFTLSDMEIFIFPELLYALVLANIMSPEIWKWKEDKWFGGISKMTPLKKIHRLKQYIMDHYNFNLDLETWGLTDKQTEIERFRDFVDIDLLSRSNALFGYEGDKYYFDIDIRKHFGLDKFDTDIIPYWKTETVEAMNAFRFKPGHEGGAGECVSLACLYAAALFIVAEIPLEKIFLMGTPLHSQNFVVVDDGVLTNNRRIVTKSMWFNGTELSSLARRALEHEQVTVVAHHTGYIHSFFPEATIDQSAYNQFREKINCFLESSIDYEVFINFLRDYSRHQKFFQVSYPCRGFMKYIVLEKAFSYEHGSKNRLGEKAGRKLLCEMEEEDFHLQPIDARFIINPDDELFNPGSYHAFLAALQLKFPKLSENKSFIHDFKKFVHTVPNLPSSNKNFSPSHHLTISSSQTREEIIEYLKNSRQSAVGSRQSAASNQYPSSIIQHPASETADLAFYAGRHMDICDWEPFLKAVFERNPVSIAFFKDCDLPTAYCRLNEWPNESIYEGNRLALPDEVVNYQHGDGIEKALIILNLFNSRHKGTDAHFTVNGSQVIIKSDQISFQFSTKKSFSLNKIIRS